MLGSVIVILFFCVGIPVGIAILNVVSGKKARARQEQAKQEREKEEQLKREKKEQEKKEKEEKARIEKERIEKEQEKMAELLENEIRNEYKKVFNIVEKYGTNCYEDELDKVLSRYEKQIGRERLHKLIHDATKEWYFEGDKIVHNILIRRMLFHLYTNMMMSHGRFRDNISECYKMAENQALSIIIRAQYFERNGRIKKGYTSISVDTCYDIMTGIDCLKNHFDESRVKLIANKFNLIEEYSRDFDAWNLPSTQREAYYMDSLCNSYMKICLQSHSETSSTDINCIFNIIYNNLKPKDQDCHKIEEEKRKSDDRDATRKEKRDIEEQCRACIWSDRCQQKDKRMNCSAFQPK